LEGSLLGSFVLCVECLWKIWCSIFHNEIFWCGECVHILIIGQMALTPSASLLGCKFYDVFFCIADYSGRIYYVVHRFLSILGMTIHLWVHKHLITNGKCKEFMDEIRRLIANDVNYMFDTKIFCNFPKC
jgi:hypothetical protein